MGAIYIAHKGQYKIERNSVNSFRFVYIESYHLPADLSAKTKCKRKCLRPVRRTLAEGGHAGRARQLSRYRYTAC
ncbi:MAG: hypothetical protein ABR936_16215 [Bacteroidota bacterium]